MNHPPHIFLPSIFTFDEGGSLDVDFSQYIIDVDEGDVSILTISDFNSISDTIDFITIDINYY